MGKSIPLRVVVLAALAAALLLVQTATAQIVYPRQNYYGGYYGAWDAYPYGPGSTYNTTLDNAAQQKMLGQSEAAAQRAAMQSGIRSTLSNQATAWNQATNNRRQDDRDWWFQTQQQQLAQRQAQQAYRPAPAAAAPAFEPATATAATVASPARANDIINWRPILYDRRFDALRAAVEAPYLRNGGKPLSQPTAADYRNMIKAFEQMKVVLKQMDAQISAREYLDTCQDIDGLIKQSRDRAEQLEAAAESKPAPAVEKQP